MFVKKSEALDDNGQVKTGYRQLANGRFLKDKDGKPSKREVENKLGAKVVSNKTRNAIYPNVVSRGAY